MHLWQLCRRRDDRTTKALCMRILHRSISPTSSIQRSTEARLKHKLQRQPNGLPRRSLHITFERIWLSIIKQTSNRTYPRHRFTHIHISFLNLLMVDEVPCYPARHGGKKAHNQRLSSSSHQIPCSTRFHVFYYFLFNIQAVTADYNLLPLGRFIWCHSDELGHAYHQDPAMPLHWGDN